MDDCDDVIPFVGGELPALARDAVPLFETLSAAGGSRVLGDEDGVVTHRGLPPVVGDVGGGEALVDECPRVDEDGIHALRPEVFELLRPEAEARAERGFSKPLEETVEISHSNSAEPASGCIDGKRLRSWKPVTEL